jgi:parvulin-like peptidyl-prolyl isomerase
MKRPFLAAILSLAALPLAFAQTTIDKPAATIKLVRQEMISVRQFKADVDKIESAIGKKLTDEQRRQLLDGKIDVMLFTQYCEREKIMVSDAQVNEALAKMKSQLGAGADDAKLDLALKSQGVLLDAKSYARQQLLLSSYLQSKKADELKAIKEPTSDEVLKAYELYKSQLVRPDTVRASVIYADQRNMGADEKKKSSDAIRQVAAQLKANPGKFDELMLRAQDAGSGIKATPTFYVEKTPQMVQVYGNKFLDTVFKMKAGEVSEVIENEAGLQVVRVNEVLPQKLLALSDPAPGLNNATVQDYLKYMLAQQKQGEVLEKIQSDLHTQLRKEGSVKVYDENLKF